MNAQGEKPWYGRSAHVMPIKPHRLPVKLAGPLGITRNSLQNASGNFGDRPREDVAYAKCHSYMLSAPAAVRILQEVDRRFSALLDGPDDTRIVGLAAAAAAILPSSVPGFRERPSRTGVRSPSSSVLPLPRSVRSPGSLVHDCCQNGTLLYFHPIQLSACDKCDVLGVRAPYSNHFHHDHVAAELRERLLPPMLRSKARWEASFGTFAATTALEANGLCFAMRDEDCALSPSSTSAEAREACASTRAHGPSCLYSCCRGLQCAWVALRPAVRCNLLLFDGRTAGEACFGALSNSTPHVMHGTALGASAVCGGQSAAAASARPVDLPVYWITLDPTSTRATRLRSQLQRVAVSHTAIAASGRAQASVALASRSLVVMSTGLLDTTNVTLSPTGPMTTGARQDPDAVVSLSVIACTLSHMKAIREAYLAGHERALILEDDVSLRSALLWPHSLSAMTRGGAVPGGNVGVLQLASHGHTFLEYTRGLHASYFTSGPDAWRRWDLMADTSSAAYVITRPAMAALLAATQTTAHGTHYIATPVHADKLLFGYSSRWPTYTRHWPLVLFQAEASGITHRPGVGQSVSLGVTLVNGNASRQIDLGDELADVPVDAALASGASSGASLGTQGDDDDDDDYVCRHHANVDWPCLSKATCPVRSVATIEACKRRCCAAGGCEMFTHNAYAECFLRRAVQNGSTPVFLADSVRHQTITCRRADTTQCQDARNRKLGARTFRTRTSPSASIDAPSHDASHLLGGTCNLTQHQWLIILSHGRSGSTTLLQMLRQLPGVALSGEHAGVMSTFRRLREQFDEIAWHVAREKTQGNPDYAWQGRLPVTHQQLLCLAKLSKIILEIF